MTSLDQVAARAGVSPRTVTRVLRGDIKEVWPSTVQRAERIRRIARQLGYRPNASASAIRRGRFDCIGLLLSTDRGRSHLPPGLFDAIQDDLAARSMHLTVAKMSDDQLVGSDAFPRILTEWCCDGLLINYTDRLPAGMAEMVHAQRTPSVWINGRHRHDCVYYDDLQGSFDVTRLLIQHGHRRIAYLDFVPFQDLPNIHYSRSDRHQGYISAMRESGLEVFPRSGVAGVPIADRLNYLVNLLGRSDRPTAIISYDGDLRLLYAAALAGLRVPQDVSLVSFGDAGQTPGENYFGRTVTQMALPVADAGRAAVEMLLRKIKRPAAALRPVVLPLTLVPGDTVAPPS